MKPHIAIHTSSTTDFLPLLSILPDKGLRYLRLRQRFGMSSISLRFESPTSGEILNISGSSIWETPSFDVNLSNFKVFLKTSAGGLIEVEYWL